MHAHTYIDRTHNSKLILYFIKKYILKCSFQYHTIPPVDVGVALVGDICCSSSDASLDTAFAVLTCKIGQCCNL